MPPHALRRISPGWAPQTGGNFKWPLRIFVFRACRYFASRASIFDLGTDITLAVSRLNRSKSVSCGTGRSANFSTISSQYLNPFQIQDDLGATSASTTILSFVEDHHHHSCHRAWHSSDLYRLLGSRS